ncbi:hypothetical protein ACOSQ3_022127 [Xanthoceras sorbifolium]
MEITGKIARDYCSWKLRDGTSNKIRSCLIKRLHRQSLLIDPIPTLKYLSFLFFALFLFFSISY